MAIIHGFEAAHVLEICASQALMTTGLGCTSPLLQKVCHSANENEIHCNRGDMPDYRFSISGSADVIISRKLVSLFPNSRCWILNNASVAVTGTPLT